MHARTHKFLHSHLKCCWDIVVFAAKTLHGTPNLICVCRQSNTFPELKASRESSNSFFKAGTMLVCYWPWYFTHIPLSFQWPWLHLAQIIWVCETFKKHCPQRGPYYIWSVKPGKEKMVGPHYTTEQRTFMEVKYARNQGTRNFMEDLIGEFQVRYPGAIPPSRMTVYRQFMKLEHFYTLHNINSKVIQNSSIQMSKTSPLKMGLHEHNGALYWIDDVRRG